MGQTSWINYGYGFKESSFEPDVDGVNELLKLAPQTKAFYEKEGYKLENIEAVALASEELGYNDAYMNNSKFGPFIRAIEELEGIRLIWASDYDGENYIMFPQSMPWLFNETEKTLTIEKLDAIFKKYLAIYCDGFFDADMVSIGYQAAENFD